MSNEAKNDEELLPELIREAGDPRVSPDPRYAERLRATIVDRAASAQESDREDVVPVTRKQGIRNMKHIIKLAVAASILVAVGFLVCWSTIGGSGNVAFAQVAQALESLRSATFDVTMEVKDYMGMEGQGSQPRPSTVMTTKGFFLAPSLQRMEMIDLH